MVDFRTTLKPEDIARYRQAGYSDQDIQDAYDDAERRANQEVSPLQVTYNQAQQIKAKDPRASSSNSYISGEYSQQNLIQWQLELDSILERLEHMLRGDRPKWVNGSNIWVPPKQQFKLVIVDYRLVLTPEAIADYKKKGFTEEEIQELVDVMNKQTIVDESIFNEFGVAEIMRILSNYVNRNTILSNYDEQTINDKMLDLGFEIADLIFLKYEDMGLNTLAKRKLYPIVCRELIDVVHSSYLRAFRGGERESLREARQVTQTDTGMNGGININTGIQPKERGLLNPFRWFGSKYK